MKIDRVLADHLLSDLYTYCTDGLGWRLFEQPHREMCNLFEEALPPVPARMENADQNQFAFAAPRETLKTSIGVQALAEYFLLKWKVKYNYDGRVLIVRAAESDAKTVLQAQRADLGGGNPVLLKAFGDLSADSRLWKENAIILNWRETHYREPSIDTSGMGQSRTGRHFDLIFLDDLVNEKNFESEAEMMAARTALQAFVPILNVWGSIVHIGTRWSNLDTTGFILELNERARKAKEPLPWKVAIRGAYLDDGSLYYPAHLSQRRLEQKRRSMTDKLFTSQYLNKVITDSSQVFDPAWLQWYDGDFTPEDEEPASLSIPYDDEQPTEYAGAQFAVNAVIVIDPAATATSDSNATGMALGLCDGDGNLWVHEAWKGREVPSKLIERIVSWCWEYAPRRLSIDTLGQQVLWIDRIQDKLREAGVTHVQVMLHKGKAVKLSGEEMKSGRGILSKASRIESLQPWFREGKIFLRRGHCDPIVQEYNFYTGPTKREHYDMLDALAQLPVVMVKPQPERYAQDLEEREMAEFGEDDAASPSRKVRGISTGREGKRLRAVV